MNEAELKELKKFVRPAAFYLAVVGGVICVASVIFFLICIFDIKRYSTETIVTSIMGILFGTVIGLFMLGFGITEVRRTDKKLKEIEANGGTELLLNDFRTGGRAFNGALIAGQIFLIGKHTGTVIAYTELKQIYQYVHSTNGVEDVRTLKAVSVNDKKPHDLCKLKLRGMSDEEVVHFGNYIISKNPNVKVGYK